MAYALNLCGHGSANSNGAFCEKCKWPIYHQKKLTKCTNLQLSKNDKVVAMYTIQKLQHLTGTYTGPGKQAVAWV